MCGNFPNIKVTEGNAFSLVLPLKKRTYESCKPIDEDIDIMSLEDVVFKFGGVVYAATKEEAGVRVLLPATLARGVYDIVLTAMYQGSEIRAAYESAVTIVAWNSQSDAQQFIPGSPIVMDAAYVIGGTLTDAELEALKDEYSEKNEQLAQAIADAEAAKREWEEKAADLDGVAKEATSQEIKTAVENIDIDTSDLAKQGTNPNATNTAILQAIGSGGGTVYPTIQMTETTAAIDPNKVYIWGEVASLDISLNAGESGVANVYFLEFYSGATPTTLTLPASVTEVRGYILANKLINVGIFNNIAYIA